AAPRELLPDGREVVAQLRDLLLLHLQRRHRHAGVAVEVDVVAVHAGERLVAVDEEAETRPLVAGAIAESGQGKLEKLARVPAQLLVREEADVLLEPGPRHGATPVLPLRVGAASKQTARAG